MLLVPPNALRRNSLRLRMCGMFRVLIMALCRWCAVRRQWYTLVRLGGELKFVLLINATDAKTTAVQIADAAWRVRLHTWAQANTRFMKLKIRPGISWRTVSCARWELKPINCSVVQSRFRPIFLYVMLGTLVHPLHLLMKMVLPGLAGCFGPWWYWLAWV